jgi:hypothetical protein
MLTTAHRQHMLTHADAPRGPRSISPLTDQSITVTVDRMVNSDTLEPRSADLRSATAVVRTYVALTVATLVALVVLSAVAPHLATQEAWGHAVIVAVFAVLLPLRMRSARRGRSLRAVTIIAAALFAVNVVEAALPHAFPAWMRVDMAVTALLMALLVGLLTGRVRR